MAKPKILCLHGAGANARIFEAQTARLGLVIRKHFDLVFLDGPIECEAGPGILPVFEGEEPFRRWHDEASDGRRRDQLEEVRLLLLRAMREQGPFAGVLGFSQGAKTALQLLQQQEEEGLGSGIGVGFGFAVLVCGTTPPEEQSQTVVQVPTLHAIADTDPWREQSEQLPAYCAEATRRVFRYTGGHHFPHLAPQNQQLADLMVEVYSEAAARARMG